MSAAERLEQQGTEGLSWQVAHARLLGFAQSRAGLDFEEGRWLVLAFRSGAHARLGYGSFTEYVERLFGYSPRLTREKLRVAEALETLPTMAKKLRDGKICWSSLRELTRVAVAETQGEWLAAAQGKTARQIEELVAGHVPGSRPSDAPDDRTRRHVLRFEVSGETLATFREAVERLRREAGERLDDDATLLLMARQILEGPRDAGRASYQVLLQLCPSCERGAQQGSGEQIAVGREVVEMAACDAQHSHESQRATQSIPPRIRRVVLCRDGGRCVFPGCRHTTFVDVHHIDSKENGGGHHPDNLATVCGAHHRAIHRGEVRMEGKVSTGLSFWHADGTPYGGAVVPHIADARAKTFQALRRLGFREAAARQALASVTHVGHDVEALLRHCLERLTAGQVAHGG